MAATRSRSAVALRQIPFEDLGNLEPALRAAGYAIQYREAPIDRLDDAVDADLLVVLGGPIGAYEEATYPFLKEELRILEKRLAADRPTLGICLGAQIMARALGGDVHAGDGKEIGWFPLRLTPGGSASALRHLEGVPVLHWHGDTFELPRGVAHLASSARYANQAFSSGRRGLGLQFHAEAVERSLERWYVGHACEIRSTAGISVAGLRAEAAKCAPALQRAAEKLWKDWLGAIER